MDALSYLSDQIIEGVEDGSYQIRVTADGSSDVLYDSGSVGITDDAIIVAVNSDKGRSPVSLLVWSGPSATAVRDNTSELRIVHAIDTQDIDVYVEGELYAPLENMSYTDVSDYILFPAGSLPISITAADAALADAPSGLSTSLELERGESYTLVASGSNDDFTSAIRIFLTDHREASQADSADIRLVNASVATDVNSADVYIYESADSSQEAYETTGVSQGDDTDYITLAPDTYDIHIVNSGSRKAGPAVVPGLTNQTVAAGDVESIVIIGKTSPVALKLPTEKRAD